MQTEIWKDIKNYEGCYQVSNLGRVRRLDTEILFFGKKAIRKGRILKFTKNSKGYPTIVLCWKSKRKTFSVHKLVADSFILKIPGYDVINHIDGDPFNNLEENLERCTQSHNQLHAYALGLKKKGSELPYAKLTEENVIEIKIKLKSRPKNISHNKFYKLIAKEFNVSRTTIKWIDKGRTWKHVTGGD